MIPSATIDALEQCWRSIDQLGTRLDEAQWKTATDCPGWSVQDHLSHLVGIERMLEGLPATTHRATALDHVHNPIGEMNEHEVDARRGLTGAEVLAEWSDITTRRLGTLRSAEADYFAREAMTPTGPGTVGDFLHIRVLDCWVHEQDMRRAVGIVGNLSGPAAELTIDRLIRTIPIVVGKRAGTPEGRAVVIDISAGVDRHVVCEVSAGRASIVATPTRPPLTTIGLDTSTFVAVATGRRAGSTAEARVSGDVDLAAAVLAGLNMMI